VIETASGLLRNALPNISSDFCNISSAFLRAVMSSVKLRCRDRSSDLIPGPHFPAYPDDCPVGTFKSVTFLSYNLACQPAAVNLLPLFMDFRKNLIVRNAKQVAIAQSVVGSQRRLVRRYRISRSNIANDAGACSTKSRSRSSLCRACSESLRVVMSRATFDTPMGLPVVSRMRPPLVCSRRHSRILNCAMILFELFHHQQRPAALMSSL